MHKVSTAVQSRSPLQKSCLHLPTRPPPHPMRRNRAKGKKKNLWLNLTHIPLSPWLARAYLPMQTQIKIPLRPGLPNLLVGRSLFSTREVPTYHSQSRFNLVGSTTPLHLIFMPRNNLSAMQCMLSGVFTHSVCSSLMFLSTLHVYLR